MNTKLSFALGATYMALLCILYMMHMRVYDDCTGSVTSMGDYMVLVIVYLIVIFPFSFLIAYAGEESNIGMFVNFSNHHEHYFDHDNEEKQLLFVATATAPTTTATTTTTTYNTTATTTITACNTTAVQTGLTTTHGKATLNSKGVLVFVSWIVVFAFPMSIIAAYDVFIVSLSPQLLTQCYQFTTLFLGKYALFVLAINASSGVSRLIDQ